MKKLFVAIALIIVCMFANTSATFAAEMTGESSQTHTRVRTRDDLLRESTAERENTKQVATCILAIIGIFAFYKFHKNSSFKKEDLAIKREDLALKERSILATEERNRIDSLKNEYKNASDIEANRIKLLCHELEREKFESSKLYSKLHSNNSNNSNYFF